MRLLIGFILTTVASATFTHESCRAGGENGAVCDYMEQFSKQYQHRDEFLNAESELKKLKCWVRAFGLTSRSDLFENERGSNAAFKSRKKYNLKSNRHSSRDHPHLGASVPNEYDLRKKTPCRRAIESGFLQLFRLFRSSRCRIRYGT